MCISVPARVISIEGRSAEVEVYSHRRQVYLAVDDVVEGEWVLVYGPVALSRLDSVEAQETIQLLTELTAGKMRSE
jgi:hydrogenase assembly chaperone HypC/HupF